MTNQFYNGPKIEIRKDYIKIKRNKLKLNYQDIRLISIKYSRVNRNWILYILTGLIGLLLILCLLFFVLKGLFSDSAVLANSGLFYRKRIVILLMFLFIGGPFFIIFKIKRYFQRHLILIIKWKCHDFRIKVSDLNINLDELKMFLEDKVKIVEFDIPILKGKK